MKLKNTKIIIIAFVLLASLQSCAGTKKSKCGCGNDINRAYSKKR